MVDELARLVRIATSEQFQTSIQQVTRAMTNLARTFEHMQPRKTCGPKPKTRQPTPADIQHRRAWRACRRFYTQVRHSPFPRGQRG